LAAVLAVEKPEGAQDSACDDGVVCVLMSKKRPIEGLVCEQGGDEQEEKTRGSVEQAVDTFEYELSLCRLRLDSLAVSAAGKGI
jgi:hypothetical protein